MTRHATEALGRDPDAHVIDLATPDWCLFQLCATTRGLLSSRSPQGGVSRDVTYLVQDRQILVPLTADDELLRRLNGLEVTLSLAGRSRDGSRWVVRTTGVAAQSLVPVGVDPLQSSRGSHPALGTGSCVSNALTVPVDRLRGYYETSLVTNPSPL